MSYPEGGPLRHLPPLTESPVPSRTFPASGHISIWMLSLVERLGEFDSTHPGASMVLTSFMNTLCLNGQLNLTIDILDCPDNEHIVQLTNHLVDAILKPFQIAGGKSPDALRKACTPLSDGVLSPAEKAVSQGRKPTTDEHLTTLHQHYLARDNLRCRITGKVDAQTYHDNLADLSGKVQPAYLDCAHIIPYAFGDADDTTEVQIRNKQIIWKAMHRYFPQLRPKIGPKTINQYPNVMMLDRSTHAMFGAGMETLRYDSSSKAGHKYRPLELWAGRPKLGTQFTIPGHPKFPVPDVVFLDVHRAVSCILRLTGLGDLILQAAGEMQRAIDSHSELDPSGSTPATVPTTMLEGIIADRADQHQGHVRMDDVNKVSRITS